MSTLGAGADPYKVLGVAKTAPLAEIKQAYFSQAKQFHPDVNSQANAKLRFLQISEAWEKISAVHDIVAESDTRFEQLRDLMPTAYKKDELERFRTSVLYPYLQGFRDLNWAEDTVRHAMELEQFAVLAREYPPAIEWRLRFHMKRVGRYLRADPGHPKYTVQWAKRTIEPYLADLTAKLRAVEKRVPHATCHALVTLHQKQIHRYFAGEWTLDQAMDVLDPLFEKHLYQLRIKLLKEQFPGKQRIVDFNLDAVTRYLVNPDKYPLEWAVRKMDKYMVEDE